MNQYEITYLIDPQVNEEARTELNSAVDSKVSELKGKVGHSSPTLRRKLAYEIDKKQSVFMRNMHIDLSPAEVATLHDFFKRTPTILRFSLINTPYREGSAPDTLKQKEEESRKKPKVTAEKKKVTMKDVEKGIEEALTEEVK
ncbi:MAG: 30S ribosomal protein S6 [Candidatus Andersenbacteria bacterium]